MNDHEFDSMLRTASAKVCANDLQAAGLAAKPRRRGLRAAAVAAAACMLLTLGVSAAWPTIRMGLRGNTITLETELLGRSGEMAESHCPVFDYMPGRYSVIWEDDEDLARNNSYICTITDGNESLTEGERGYIWVFPCGSQIQFSHTVSEDAPVSSEEQAELIYENTLILDSIADLTQEDLNANQYISWSDGGNTYYVLCATLDKTELFRILKNMN